MSETGADVLSHEQRAQVEELLKPLSVEEPCGPALRFDPMFTALRMDREEDDPRLPMGQWERPLKVADWVSIEERCTQFLLLRSKDLQMAAWLLEAWLRRRGMVGVLQGLHLIHGLMNRHWDAVHPRIDLDGDCDGRVAPLEWLNEQLPLWLRVHVSLAEIPESRPPRFSLDDWNRLTHQEVGRQTPESAKSRGNSSTPPDGVPGERTRDDVLQAVRALGAKAQRRDLALTKACVAVLGELNALLKDRLGVQGPSLAKIIDELQKLDRALAVLCASLEDPADANAPTPPTDEARSETVMDNPEEGEASVAAAPAVLGAPRGPWTSREQAYKSLEAIAEYLARTEPHSPTPYLIRRAVNWGRMPLPELMAEIIREEGDLNKLVSMLGVSLRDE